MKNLIRKGLSGFAEFAQKAHAGSMAFINTHGTALMFIIGSCLLVVGLTEVAQAQQNFIKPNYCDQGIKDSVGLLFKLIEGSFGALIMVVAGIGAIIAAAFGAYRAAVGMLVVAVGAFILRALVSLFFGGFNAPANVV